MACHLERMGGRHLALIKAFSFARESWSGSLDRMGGAVSSCCQCHQTVTKGVGAVIRGKSSEAAPRVVVTAGKVFRPCRSSVRMKLGSSRRARGSCCAAEVGRRRVVAGVPSTYSLNGGHAHHDARRGWEEPFRHQTVQSSDGCRWKASWSVEREHLHEGVSRKQTWSSHEVFRGHKGW